MSSDRTDIAEERTKSAVFPDETRHRRALVFWQGFAQTIDLPRAGTLTIGRSPECAIRIDHTSVSRRHAVLHVSTSLAIEDLGSSNGTRLSGQRIAGRTLVPLAPGTLVEVGLATLVIHGDDLSAVVSSEATATVPPPPVGAAVDGATEPSMVRLHRLIDLVASSRISIILLGETGVGKEVIAERLHARSPRANRPLIRLNCAALPEALLEAELFGYERGAFTGAVQAKPGLIEAAEGGTILLDEAAELPPATQAKLLRVLESREVMPLGSLSPRSVDVRFVAATHTDLESLVRNGRFREDLYYRLNGMTITIPPLRDRALQIPSLVSTFVANACREHGWPPVGVEPPSLAVLCRYRWPGNVRELRNVVERAVVLAQGSSIGLEHLVGLPLDAASPSEGAEETRAPQSAPGRILRTELATIERQRILEALEISSGNQSRAAKLLGVSRRTFLKRLDAYQVPRPRKPRGGDPNG